MQNRKTIFAIGLIIFLLPVLGFPRGFESFLQVIGGLMLMFFAGRKQLERRIVKDKRPKKRREKNPVFVESDASEFTGKQNENLEVATEEVNE